MLETPLDVWLLADGVAVEGANAMSPVVVVVDVVVVLVTAFVGVELLDWGDVAAAAPVGAVLVNGAGAVAVEAVDAATVVVVSMEVVGVTVVSESVVSAAL